MLSSFESALLDRHLRKCPSCRAFAEGTAAQTELLRGIRLEPLPHPIELPERGRSRVRAFASAGAAVAVAAAVAVSTVTLGNGRSVSTASHRVDKAPAGKQIVVYAAHPGAANTTVEVPRLRVEPASYADGPVHGMYSVPA
jgi:predicted anti-sigma-YlaC factor YlaD